MWLGALVGLGVATQTSGSAYSTSQTLPGTESGKALELLEEASPNRSGSTDTLVWHVQRGSVRDAAVEQRMAAALEQIAAVPQVGVVTGPYAPEGVTQISGDSRTAYAQITYTHQANDLKKSGIERIVDIAEAARFDGLEVELGGPGIQSGQAPSAHLSELVGIVAAAVILFVAFGSILAMTVPIITAVIGLGTAVFAMGLLAHAFPIADLAPTLGALVGLGVGIDYALFIVTRHRSGLKSGMTTGDSVVRAVNTSGRAVLFAGATVVIALLGMLVLELSFLNGMAVAAALTVACTMATAVTLLPAVLSLLGRRILGRRDRRALTDGRLQEDSETSPFWSRWARTVERHPKALSAVALAVLAVLIVPVFSLRLASSDAGNDPASTTTRKTYDLLADGFGPGFNGPLQLVVELPPASDPAALTVLADRVRTVGGVAQATAMPIDDGSPIGVVRVVPTTAPQSADTSELIERLREDVVPPIEQQLGAPVYVAGQTAIDNDFAEVLADKMPVFVAVIVGLGFLLLMLAFRSIVVPATAAIMNLVAAAASFGVVVAMFQWGWGSEAMGLGTGPVETFLPVLMLPVLFGLSMDYQVFLVSRMHEEWQRSNDNARAVIVGQSRTGRVITAAAAIMVAVFCAFILGGERVIAEFGVGLAVAVALDAFILRTVLVPAVMHLAGTSNWWLPAWMDRWIPRMSVEGPEDAAAANANTDVVATTTGPDKVLPQVARWEPEAPQAPTAPPAAAERAEPRP